MSSPNRSEGSHKHLLAVPSHRTRLKVSDERSEFLSCLDKALEHGNAILARVQLDQMSSSDWSRWEGSILDATSRIGTRTRTAMIPLIAGEGAEITRDRSLASIAKIVPEESTMERRAQGIQMKLKAMKDLASTEELMFHLRCHAPSIREILGGALKLIAVETSSNEASASNADLAEVSADAVVDDVRSNFRSKVDLELERSESILEMLHSSQPITTGTHNDLQRLCEQWQNSVLALLPTMKDEVAKKLPLQSIKTGMPSWQALNWSTDITDLTDAAKPFSTVTDRVEGLQAKLKAIHNMSMSDGQWDLGHIMFHVTEKSFTRDFQALVRNLESMGAEIVSAEIVPEEEHVDIPIDVVDMDFQTPLTRRNAMKGKRRDLSGATKSQSAGNTGSEESDPPTDSTSTGTESDDTKDEEYEDDMATPKAKRRSRTSLNRRSTAKDKQRQVRKASKNVLPVDSSAGEESDSAAEGFFGAVIKSQEPEEASEDELVTPMGVPKYVAERHPKTPLSRRNALKDKQRKRSSRNTPEPQNESSTSEESGSAREASTESENNDSEEGSNESSVDTQEVDVVRLRRTRPETPLSRSNAIKDRQRKVSTEQRSEPQSESSTSEESGSARGANTETEVDDSEEGSNESSIDTRVDVVKVRPKRPETPLSRSNAIKDKQRQVSREKRSELQSESSTGEESDRVADE